MIGAASRLLVVVVALSAAGCSKQVDDVAMCESMVRYFLKDQKEMHFLSAQAKGVSVEVLIKGDELPMPVPFNCHVDRKQKLVTMTGMFGKPSRVLYTEADGEIEWHELRN